ncbi:MAG: putative toxin-antitoxin system toxin component, PIN family [Nanoarchaeota archaeon]|nr:putative toxin-antitoxin system toxin component, PIN family [Nanoarchaeota archaeon]MBU1321199.1 putative toxin-antitoxin system toxin component, PIN family [Nanoarchaeota archaeon]MBU1597004.1 putative toxin-antitoxin system toxin component, PIN family [Nanoarchaeota archaeon]MBU2441850.1 putative toxin-antitoxin system toxin component, PIN family [Nanoarchaeota archaeon]
MRVIIDTNVFVSGIFWKGNFCSQIIDKWRNRKFDLITSMEILDEFVKTLKNFKIKIPYDMITEWKNLIIENSIIVESTIKINVVKDDPDDNKFLEAGITGKVDFIISQDKHLLKLKKYQEIKVITPEEAVLLL